MCLNFKFLAPLPQKKSFRKTHQKENTGYGLSNNAR